MSLQVWLPLNGNLNNQGLSHQVNNISTTPIWAPIGKIGKDALYTKTRMTTMNFPELEGVSIYSVAYWLYIPTEVAPTAWSDMFGIQFNCGGTNVWERDERRAATTTGRHNYHLAKSGSEGANTNAYYGTKEDDSANDNWIHIVLTKDNDSAKLYFNGQLQMTINANAFEDTPRTMTGNIYLGDNGCEAYLQDFRIYNHCLSKKEIEEISKGLVLHYKLDNNGLGGDNFLTNSSFRTKVNNFPSVSSSYTQTFEVVDGYECFHIHSDTLEISSSLGWNVKDLINAHPIGTKFTFSGWIKTDNIVKGTTNYFASLYYGGSYNNNGTSAWIGEGSRIASNPSSNSAFDLSGQGWKYCYIVSTFTRNDYTGMSALYYLRDFKGDIYLRDFKLEVGDKPTSWSPALSDLKIPDNIIYDSSGYQNNSNLVGNLTISSLAPRYNASSLFESYLTPYTQLQDTSILPAITDGSISWWEYCTTTGNSLPFVGQSGSYYIGAGSQSTRLYDSNIGTAATIYKDGILETNHTSSGVTNYHGGIFHTQGSWHHFVLTNIDLSSWTQFYINHYSTGWPLNAYLSDVRIYTTSLTAEQVKELYDTSATIDKNGNIYAREVIE